LESDIAGINSPVLLTRSHILTEFDSTEPTLNEWLRVRAWNNLLTAASRTYVICPGNSQRVIGYYAMSMGQILATDVAGSMRRNMPRHIPAIVLGRLALDREYQGKGLGGALLANAVRRSIRASAEVAARLIVVHAISPAAEAFYLHHGFSRLPLDTSAFALDLVKASAFDRVK
jgi:GNAT superfamily N-acetyltransferase